MKLPDGSPLSLPAGASGTDAAAAIGPRLAGDALGIRVNGELRDLAAPLPDGARIAIVTPTSEGEDGDAALWLIRHDAAHVMATAVVEVWPGTKVSIGPPIEGGFYYDFEFPDGERPSEADLFAFQTLVGLLLSNGPGTITAQGTKGAVSSDGPEQPQRVQLNKAMLGFLSHWRS